MSGRGPAPMGRFGYAAVLLGLVLACGVSWAVEIRQGTGSVRGAIPSARLALLAVYLLGYLAFGYALAREAVLAGVPLRVGMGVLLALPVAWYALFGA